MGDISKMAVVLTANASGFASGLAPAQTALTGLGATAQRMGGILSGFGSLLGGLGLGFSLWKGFEGAGEAEKNVATLNAVLHSTGEAAGFNGEQMQKMATDLASVTTFSKGAVVSGEAVLATFTNIRGDQFKQAMTAAADMSTVLKTDLQSSVTMIGKALNDPAKGYAALKRAGVSFTQEQIEQIKTLQASGDILGAQKIILGELGTEYGGAGQAAGGTFANQIDKAKASVGAIAGVIASGMMPGLAGMANLLKKGAEWAKAHSTELKSLGKGILVVIGAIAAYKTAMIAITVVQKGWNAIQAATLALQGPKGWIQLAAAGAILAGTYIAIESATQPAVDAMTAAADGTKAVRKEMAGMDEDADEAVEGLGKVESAATKLWKHGHQVAMHMKEQIDTFGMTSHQAEVFKLKTEGATAAQIAQLDVMAQKLDAMERQKKAMEEMTEAAKKLTEEIADPWEKLAEQMAEVDKLQRAGLLTAAQADKATAKVVADMEKATPFSKQAKPFEPKNFSGEKLDAVERRFTAGFTKDNLPWQQQLAKDNAQIAKNTADTTKAIDRLANRKEEVASIGG